MVPTEEQEVVCVVRRRQKRRAIVRPIVSPDQRATNLEEEEQERDVILVRRGAHHVARCPDAVSTVITAAPASSAPPGTCLEHSSAPLLKDESRAQPASDISPAGFPRVSAGHLPHQRLGPRRIEEVVGRSRQVATLKAWLAQQRGSGAWMTEVAILRGPVGTGKSMVARLFLHSVGYAFTEYTPASTEQLGAYMDKLGTTDCTGKSAALIIDDLPEAIANQRETSLLRRKCRVPIIATCNILPRELAKLAKHVINFPRIGQTDARTILLNASARLGITPSHSSLASIVLEGGGDARQMITQMTLVMNPQISTRDIALSPLEMVRKVLQGEWCAEMDTANGYSADMLFENFCQVGTLDECASFAAYCSAIDALALWRENSGESHDECSLSMRYAACLLRGHGASRLYLHEPRLMQAQQAMRTFRTVKISTRYGLGEKQARGFP